jgi:hypothetical protein
MRAWLPKAARAKWPKGAYFRAIVFESDNTLKLSDKPSQHIEFCKSTDALLETEMYVYAEDLAI